MSISTDYEGGFRMIGDITVVNGGYSSHTAGNTFDTAGVLMVPTMIVQDVVSGMRSGGFGIDSMHNFKDLRGYNQVLEYEQTLVDGKQVAKVVHEITSQLQEISTGLPYL